LHERSELFALAVQSGNARGGGKGPRIGRRGRGGKKRKKKYKEGKKGGVLSLSNSDKSSWDKAATAKTAEKSGSVLLKEGHA